MKYNNIIPAVFLSRPNRFIAVVDAGNGPEQAHVKNTGRCKELLVRGCRVYLSVAANSERSTKYDLVAVEKKQPNGTTTLINMDSQAPNEAVAEWLNSSGLFSKNAIFRREITFNNSRFDFGIIESERVSYLEVKGVTLEQNGVALFPDAPTLRGVKHIEELINCANNGIGAYIVFVVQMKGVSVFRPNEATHPEFAKALRTARDAGVRILAVDCSITSDSMKIENYIKIEL